jgi:hypothetical protein
MPEESPPQAPICFFLGAGASKPAGIPATFGFVEEYRKQLASNPRLKREFERVYDILLRWSTKGPEPLVPLDIELLLECLSLAINPRTNVAGAFLSPVDAENFSSPAMTELLEDLRAFIRRRCAVDPEKTSYWRNLLGFIQTYGRTHIFSTNYDLVMETFLERYGYPYTDGFDQSWNPDLFDAAQVQACLYKLHGSVSWYRTDTGAYFKLPVRDPPAEVRSYSGTKATPLILYPAQKLDYSGPFLDMLGRLSDRLREAVAVVVVGYSFRDPHIARIFVEALSANPSLVVILVGPSAREVYEKRLAGIRVDRMGVAPLDAPSDTSSIRGRVFPIPTTIENAAEFLYSYTIPRLIEAVRTEYDVREKDLRFQEVDYSEVLNKYLQAGFLDRCETIEPLAGEIAFQSPRPFNYLARKWAVAAAFRSERESEVSWALFLQRLSEYVSSYLWVQPTGGRNVSIRFVVGEKPGSGTVHEGQDVANWWQECYEFAEDFAAYAGPGPKQEWIMARVRQMGYLAPYFRTMSTAASNTKAYFDSRLGEVHSLGVGFETGFKSAAELAASINDSGFRDRVVPEISRLEKNLLQGVISAARPCSLGANPSHDTWPRNPWRDRRPGPKVPKELR